MDEKEKADLYLHLADRAGNRFEARRNLEWKTAFGIWTLFAAATAVVLATRDLPVGWVLAALVGVSLVAAIFVPYVLWILWLGRKEKKDRRFGLHFEQKVLEDILNEELPEDLKPEEYPEVKGLLHPVYLMQLWIAAVLALLFFSVFVCKGCVTSRVAVTSTAVQESSSASNLQQSANRIWEPVLLTFSILLAALSLLLHWWFQQTRIEVTPKVYELPVDKESRPESAPQYLAIEVANQSGFPITITELGLVVRERPWSRPEFIALRAGDAQYERLLSQKTFNLSDFVQTEERASALDEVDWSEMDKQGVEIAPRRRRTFRIGQEEHSSGDFGQAVAVYAQTAHGPIARSWSMWRFVALWRSWHYWKLRRAFLVYTAGVIARNQASQERVRRFAESRLAEDQNPESTGEDAAH